MQQEMVRYVVDGKKLFSIMIDESTTIANSQVMIIYLRTEFEDEVCTFFLGLIPVVQPSATDLKRELCNFLHVIGLTDAVLAEQLIGFCSDGASTMVRMLQWRSNIAEGTVSEASNLSLHGAPFGIGSKEISKHCECSNSFPNLCGQFV